MMLLNAAFLPTLYTLPLLIIPPLVTNHCRNPNPHQKLVTETQPPALILTSRLALSNSLFYSIGFIAIANSVAGTLNT